MRHRRLANLCIDENELVLLAFVCYNVCIDSLRGYDTNTKFSVSREHVSPRATRSSLNTENFVSFTQFSIRALNPFLKNEHLTKKFRFYLNKSYQSWKFAGFSAIFLDFPVLPRHAPRKEIL